MSAPGAAALLGLALAGPVLAQSSASYEVEAYSFNNGGVPFQGGSRYSPDYRIRLESIGDPLTAATLSSAAYHMHAGFVTSYAPPGEVRGLRFTDHATLAWDPDPFAVEYEVYRASTWVLSFPYYEACFAMHLSTATAADATDPFEDESNFYLVTARNRLGEESTLGYRSDGTRRVGPVPCP